MVLKALDTFQRTGGTGRLLLSATNRKFSREREKIVHDGGGFSTIISDLENFGISFENFENSGPELDPELW